MYPRKDLRHYINLIFMLMNQLMEKVSLIIFYKTKTYLEKYNKKELSNTLKEF